MIPSLICLIALILLIWFKTNAFVEYALLFKFAKFVKVDEYEMVVLENNGDLIFPDFLKEFHNNFITRLLSCAICTSVWLALFISAILVVLKGILMIFAFPPLAIFGLSLYLIISKLL